MTQPEPRRNGNNTPGKFFFHLIDHFIYIISVARSDEAPG